MRSFFFRQLRHIKPLLLPDQLIYERQQVTALILWWELVCKRYQDDISDDERKKTFVAAYRAAQHEFAYRSSVCVNTQSALTLSKFDATSEENHSKLEAATIVPLPTPAQRNEDLSKKRKIDEYQLPDSDDFETTMTCRVDTTKAPENVTPQEEAIKQFSLPGSTQLRNGHVYLPVQPMTFIPSTLYLPPSTGNHC